MEYASSWLYEREDAQARTREEQLRPGMPTTVLVRKAARLLGRELEEDRATKLGTWTHYAFGAAGGPTAKLLTARGIPPLTAGLAVATGMSVFADEGLNTLLGLTPPPKAFPWQAHARGFAAHAVYGIILGLMLSAGAEN
jgi:hypothetical protein